MLTADEGSPSPAPDSFEYSWFADGNDIGGATNKTFTPTNAEVGKQLTVEVTAKKTGYVDASDISDPTAAVSTPTMCDGLEATTIGQPGAGEDHQRHRWR